MAAQAALTIMVMVPLGAAIGGSIVSLVAFVAAVGSGGTDLAPYVGVGSSGIAVVGIVFVLRAVLNGTLVARPVAEVEAKLLELVQSGQTREKVYENILKRNGRA